MDEELGGVAREGQILGAFVKGFLEGMECGHEVPLPVWHLALETLKVFAAMRMEELAHPMVVVSGGKR